MKGRSSRRITATFSTVYYRCNDDECGATYAAGLEITHMISPSGKPDPAVKIPLRPTMRRSSGPPPPPANDDLDESAAAAAVH